MTTRVDDDIQKYLDAMLTKEHVSEKDINSLLNAYREKFDLDLVYVCETLEEQSGILIMYNSYSKDLYNHKGEKVVVNETEWRYLETIFDEDGITEHGIVRTTDNMYKKTDKGGLHYSALNYGLFRQEVFDGVIGFMDYKRERIWSKEEREAVSKLGRIFRHIVESERLQKIYKNDKRMLYSQTKDIIEIGMENDRHIEMINCLNGEYYSIFFLNYKRNSVIPYRKSEYIKEMFDSGNITIEEFAKIMKVYMKNVHEDDKDEFRQILDMAYVKDMLKKKKSIVINYRYNTPKGEEYYRLQVVKAGDTEDIEDVVVATRSVDEEMKTEKKKRELLENALQQANLASKAKSDFLSNMSHDIRTPMNAVIGFTALAKNHIEETDKVKEYIEKITISSNHLLRLINNILDMSRIESGKTKIEEDKCNLNDIIGEVSDIVKSQAVAKNLEYSVSVDIKDEMVYCDKLKLNQIFFNLLGNAVKYTKNGGMVSFEAKQVQSKSNEYSAYLFTVKDTGVGMTEMFLSKVFEPFERERTEQTMTIQGTGLGLAITKNIIDMMGGRIEVKSNLGKGSRFKVFLELKSANNNSDNKMKKSQENIKSNEEILKDKYILLVEDNEINAEISKEILEEKGMIVEHANNGKVAVDMFAESDYGYYDMILMDIQMPVMNGYDATEAIREFEREDAKNIPIVALSANAFDEDIRKSLKHGMNAHISKPIVIDDLISTLSHILNV